MEWCLLNQGCRGLLSGISAEIVVVTQPGRHPAISQDHHDDLSGLLDIEYALEDADCLFALFEAVISWCYKNSLVTV
jgi:hypothetical protein